MDIRRMETQEKVDLSRKYFLGGCFFLPFLWAVNAVWFFKDAFAKESFPGQNKIRSNVVKSAIGAGIWLIVLITWNVIFQIKRPQWGEFGDRLSAIIPRGIA
ncbi:gamma-secretase subunit PEN-2 [Galendromus occidentalis]|uniref:Gamma-secretase subunit PEN-2 n=1 Tax=Galendromus occidentalis TaxID=34638 RepID=A0AAJ6QUU1_9ACAR|nr:gamma-secretase subunit PEN-2 [Galendromus occidentalis]